MAPAAPHLTAAPLHVPDFDAEVLANRLPVCALGIARVLIAARNAGRNIFDARQGNKEMTGWTRIAVLDAMNGLDFPDAL